MQSDRARSLAVVILAAGLGKRMYSQLPKVLHPLLGEPMLGHVLRVAGQLQPSAVAVVCGHGGEQVRAFVADWTQRNSADLPDGVRPQCIDQPHQGGTGHAVQCAQPAWQNADEVLILYGDTPLLTAETLNGLLAARGDGLLALLVGEMDDPTGYGRVVLNGERRIARVTEHKDADEATRQIKLINAGMMAARKDFLAASLPQLKADNAQGELYLTDLLAMAADQGQPAAPCIVADRAQIQGVNNRAELAQASAHLRRRINRQWMLTGVTMDDPDSVTIETTVALQPDCRIGANVELRGQTAIAAGAHIDRGCVLTDVQVADGAHVLPYTVAAESAIGQQAHVGPFAHLRPGTRLEAKVKVGNFVETKKAHLGPGAKASHLSYLGDAEIGADCNIGAGTITCNYDGVHKHKTVLGRGVFIGSDTQLVAPVTLGDEAYVGAGTTVTADVPAGALVITRAPAVIKEGWVARKKAAQGRR